MTRTTIRRILAAALALALLMALPAFAESEPEEFIIDATAAGTRAEPGAEELEVVLAEPDAAPAPGEAAPTEAGGSLANDSKPVPDYEGKRYNLTLRKNRSFSMMVWDTLEVKVPGGNIKSVTSSKKDIVDVFYYSGAPDTVLTAEKVGKAKVTIKTKKGKKYVLTVTVKDPYVPKALSVTEKNVPVLAGQDFDMANYIAMEPAYARSTFTFKSSAPSVAKVSANGVVTGVKAGVATISLVSANGLKAKLDVTVSANRTGRLHAKPTEADARAQGAKWTLWPRNLEAKGNDKLICRLDLLNGGGGKITALKNLDLAILLDTDEGEVLVARTAFKSVSVTCDENSAGSVALTFPAEGLYCAGQALADIPAEQLRFRLYGKPKALSGEGSLAYQATEIPVGKDTSAENPVTYRALLVSENDFYFSDEPDDIWGWEHDTRNREDVKSMKKLLEGVKTPDGSRYTVKVKHNTSRDELARLITKTFAGADENDVSLFFIASHGDSGDDTPDDHAGAIVMASASEVYPEDFYLYELRDLLLKVPGKVIVILQTCGSGAAIYENGADDYEARARAAAAFDEKAARLFMEADPGVLEPVRTEGGDVANTGEFRRANKFYVLCCSAVREESWGKEPFGDVKKGFNYFTVWLTEGVGASGKMPADEKYAGNHNGMVDLHELYRYISGVGDRHPFDATDGTVYQHVQVYPSDTRFALFR